MDSNWLNSAKAMTAPAGPIPGNLRAPERARARQDEIGFNIVCREADWPARWFAGRGGRRSNRNGFDRPPPFPKRTGARLWLGTTNWQRKFVVVGCCHWDVYWCQCCRLSTIGKLLWHSPAQAGSGQLVGPNWSACRASCGRINEFASLSSFLAPFRLCVWH